MTTRECVCVCVSPPIVSSNSWALLTYWGPEKTADMNRKSCLVCVGVLLSGGLGQGVTGAVADPGEGLLTGQGPHSIYPVTQRPHRGNLGTAPVQQQVGRPEGTQKEKSRWTINKLIKLEFQIPWVMCCNISR